MVTADIQEAYTNINVEMNKKAKDIIGVFVEYEGWKIQLMKKLVDLVLGQNYAETSGGLLKFKKVLPMGFTLSGEALDLVALADEMTVLLHLRGGPDIQKARFKIGELKDYPRKCSK